MDCAINEYSYKWNSFIKVNDHYMAIFQHFLCNIQWLKLSGGTTWLGLNPNSNYDARGIFN